MSSLYLRFLLICLFLATTLQPSLAQDATGIVQGTVFMTDPDGTRSPIPGVSVVIKGPGPARQVIADQQAVYRFS